jgi:hypothetical protein
MQATQTTKQANATKYGFTVTEAEAASARKAHEDRKTASKEAKKYAEALRLDRQADIERDRREAAELAAKAEAEALATVAVAPVVHSKMGLIISKPSPTEMAQAEDQREADRLRYLREEARKTADRLFYWMRDTIPSRDVIEREFMAALFVPVEDDDTAYRCEGVVIHTDEVDRVRVQEARDAKRRVLDVLRGTDLTAKLAALDAESFEFSHEDDRGNKVYSKWGVEVILFMSGVRRDGRDVSAESTPRPKKSRGCELVTMTKEDHERNRQAKIAAKLSRRPAPEAKKAKVDKKAEKEAKKNKKGGK